MIDFDPQAHTYRVDGIVLPSVTQVISAAGLCDDVFYTEESRLRGTAVHLACEYLDRDELDTEWLKAWPYAGYVHGYQRFRRETGFVPELIEHRVHNAQYGYCGTLDRTGRFDQSVAIVDLKSGCRERQHKIQTAAYAACLDKPRRFRRMTVYLALDGSYSIDERTPGQFAEDFNIFCAALLVARFRGGIDGHSGSTHAAA